MKISCNKQMNFSISITLNRITTLCTLKQKHCRGEHWIFFFLSGFFFTVTDDSQDSRAREGTIFYSILPFPPAHEHSDIYLYLNSSSKKKMKTWLKNFVKFSVFWTFWDSSQLMLLDPLVSIGITEWKVLLDLPLILTSRMTAFYFRRPENFHWTNLSS